MDLAQLAGDAARAQCNGYLLAGLDGDNPDLRASEHYVPVEDLVELVEASALVSWSGLIPTADSGLYSAHRSYAQALAEVDPSGILWLLSLSLNKLPLMLRGSSTPASTWFEEVVFRIATRLFGLRGRRLGAEALAQREPDAFFVCGEPKHAVLMDAKAAREGFEMSAAEERKLLEYMGAPRQWYGETLSATRMVIVSSSYGTAAQFATRRRAFEARGYALTYVTAEGMLRLAVQLSQHPEGNELARFLDWTPLLDSGEPSVANFDEMYDLAVTNMAAASVSGSP